MRILAVQDVQLRLRVQPVYHEHGLASCCVVLTSGHVEVAREAYQSGSAS